MSNKTELELAVENLAKALKNHPSGRQDFKNILAFSVQDDLMRNLSEDDEILEMTPETIVEASNAIAEDFMLTLENQEALDV